MINLPKNELKKFGILSLEIAKQEFKSDKCVDNFIKQILSK